MIAPSPAPTRDAAGADDGLPALVAWHAGWTAAMAVLALGGPAVGLAGGPTVLAVVLTALPGLAGLGLLWRDGWAERAMLLALWGLIALVAAGLTGGVGGALAGFVFMPLAAGIALNGRGLAQGGALASGLAALAGLLSLWVGGEGPGAPGLAALSVLIAMTALAVAARLASVQRRRELDAAQAGVARVETLLAAQPGLTLVLEPSGRVLAAYGAPPPGLPADPLFAEGLIASVHAPDRPAVLAAIDNALAGGEAQAQFAPRLGLDRRVVLVVRRIDEDRSRLMAQAFDATDQHAREAGLEASRAEAEALNAGKSRFLANMSHELRTPLNAVIGFSDIMRQRLFGPLPERYAEYAQSIHEAGGHLLDLINDVLDVSKIEAERYELSIERFDAREVVSAAITLLRLQANEKGVDLAGVLPGEPLMVDADRRALKQMSLNLLSNAVKFTPKGGAVTVTLDVVRTDLELVVADTGVGIAPGDLARLGRPFEQAGGAEQRAQGTGLGLSLVRSLAELHGGRMTIESTLGEGAAVTVRLPVLARTRAGVPEGGAQIIPLNATG